MANFGNQGARKPNLPAIPGASGALAVGQFEIVEPRCKVCQSPYRRHIDAMLATGMTEASVLAYWQLALGDGVFSKDSLNRHGKRHMSVDDASVRKIYELRARQFGVDSEAAEGFITTKAGVLDTIIFEGMKNLRRGDTVAEAKDVLAAIQILDKLEAEWHDTAVDEMLTEFKLFTEAVKAKVGEELYGEIFEQFERLLDGRSTKALNPIVLSPPELEAGEVVAEEESDA